MILIKMASKLMNPNCRRKSKNLSYFSSYLLLPRSVTYFLLYIWPYTFEIKMKSNYFRYFHNLVILIFECFYIFLKRVKTRVINSICIGVLKGQNTEISLFSRRNTKKIVHILANFENKNTGVHENFILTDIELIFWNNWDENRK